MTNTTEEHVKRAKFDEIAFCDGCGRHYPRSRLYIYPPPRPDRDDYEIRYCVNCERFRKKHGIEIEGHQQYMIRDAPAVRNDG